MDPHVENGDERNGEMVHEITSTVPKPSLLASLKAFWGNKNAKKFTLVMVIGFLAYEMFWASVIVHANLYLFTFFTLKHYLIMMPVMAWGFIAFAPKRTVATWQNRQHHVVLLKVTTSVSFLGALVSFIPSLPWLFFLQWLARVEPELQFKEFSPDPVLAITLVLAGLLSLVTATVAVPWFVVRCIRITGYKRDEKVERLDFHPSRVLACILLMFVIVALFYAIDLLVSTIFLDPSSLQADPMSQALYNAVHDWASIVPLLEMVLFTVMSLFFYWDVRRLLPQTNFLVNDRTTTSHE